MKLVIIGGAGYIGSHVVIDALERGYDITVFDDLSRGYKENINENVQFIHGST
ncbi:MAG: NAD-dependent epimerase/dehydratase family protein, partial [Candidatus Neomarinimicrobiota bacterium]